jgi:hypothetical protein
MKESRADRARRVLASTHQEMREATKKRIEVALVELKNKNLPVTRKNLQAETADSTTVPPTPGIHPSTMGRNQGVLDLIEEAQDVLYPSVDLTHVSINHLRENRVLSRALARLKRRKSTELAEYTLVLEEEVIALWRERAELQLRNESLELKKRELEQIVRRGPVVKKGKRRKAIKKAVSVGESQDL